MARSVPANTVVVEVTDTGKLSASDRTAATNWMTAVNAQINANGANFQKSVSYEYPPKGSKTVPANTVVISVNKFSKLSSTDRTAAVNWLTAIIATVVAAGATLKSKQKYIYPPKG